MAHFSLKVTRLKGFFPPRFSAFLHLCVCKGTYYKLSSEYMCELKILLVCPLGREIYLYNNIDM